MLDTLKALPAKLAVSVATAFRAFFIGLVRAVLGIKSVILLYLANLVFGAIMAIPIYALASSTLQRSPGARSFLTAFDAAFITDLMRGQEAVLAAAGRVAMVSALVFFLSLAFLQGGVLTALSDRRRPLNFTTFFAACGRHLFPFCRVLVPAAIVLLLLALLNDLASSGLTWWFNEKLQRTASAELLGFVMVGKTMLFLSLFVLLVVLPVQLARIRCVVDNDRFMLRCYWKGLLLTLKSPLIMLLFFALSSLTLLAVVGLQDWLARMIDWEQPWRPLALLDWGFDPAIPADMVYLLLAQATVFVVQLLLVMKSGGLLLIYDELNAPLPEQDPELAYAPSSVDAPHPRRRGVSRTLTALLVLSLSGSSLSAQIEPVPELPQGPFNNEYAIEVALDAERMMLDGVAQVLFRNLSDAAVDEVPFHLYPNAWANTETPWILDGQARDQVLERGSEDAGYLLVHSVQDGAGMDLGAATRIEGTVMRVRLPAPLEPGGEFRFRISFQTKLPRIVARMGKLGRHVNAMQWFPKLCAHQAGRFVDYSFRNPSEFFADFGRYRVQITVPNSYLLEATGMARGEPQLDLERGTRTVSYEAEAVHDFAWCASPNFIRHEAITDRGTQIVLLSQPFLEPKAELVLEAAQFALERYAEWVFPYPYPKLVIDAQPHGQGGGMEYPMLFTISSSAPEFLSWIARRSENPAGVTVHEFSHQYWYGMVASNEFEEAWLDEGFTTYMTYKVMEELFPEAGSAPGLPALQAGKIYLDALNSPPFLTHIAGFAESPMYRADRSGTAQLFGFAIPSLLERGSSGDRFLSRKDSYIPFADNAPLKNLSWEVYREGRRNAYVATAYSKPALMLRTLEGQIGWARMQQLISTWSRRYAFQHPDSEDFIAVADSLTAGKYHDFLDGCIHGSESIDYAVEYARSYRLRPVAGFVLPEQPGAELKSSFPEPPEPAGPKGLIGRLLSLFGDDDELEDADGEAATEALYASEVIVRNRGRLWLGTKLELRFSDGSTEEIALDEERPWYRITPEPRAARLISAVVDPGRTIALDLDLSNNGRLTVPDRGAARSFGTFYQFWAQSFLSGVAWFS